MAQFSGNEGKLEQRRVKALMIGDVVGQSGLKALFAGLGPLVRSTGAQIVIANGENAQAGFGIGAEEAQRLFEMGVAVITSGNHVWEKPGAAELLGAKEALLRPANYPDGAPGRGVTVIDKGGQVWAILNLQGREGMYSIDCPFRKADDIVEGLHRDYPGAIILVDFHAESAAEKEALAFWLDGRISGLAGTHTHVQTADERILPKGTGYITDLGMTGPDDSVIGMRADICLRRGLTQMPIKMETAEGPASISGVLFTIDTESKRCTAIERIRA